MSTPSFECCEYVLPALVGAAHVAVEVEGKELTWVLRERVSLSPEQRVRLSFATSKAHFFDRGTQQRLDA